MEVTLCLGFSGDWCRFLDVSTVWSLSLLSILWDGICPSLLNLPVKVHVGLSWTNVINKHSSTDFWMNISLHLCRSTLFRGAIAGPYCHTWFCFNCQIIFWSGSTVFFSMSTASTAFHKFLYFIFPFFKTFYNFSRLHFNPVLIQKYVV